MKRSITYHTVASSRCSGGTPCDDVVMDGTGLVNVGTGLDVADVIIAFGLGVSHAPQYRRDLSLNNVHVGQFHPSDLCAVLVPLACVLPLAVTAAVSPFGNDANVDVPFGVVFNADDVDDVAGVAVATAAAVGRSMVCVEDDAPAL
jgi:hypothetical protein